MSGLYLSYWETLDVPIPHKDCRWTAGVSWFWPKVILAIKGHWKGMFKFLAGLFKMLLIENHWAFLHYTKIAFDPRFCHDFDPYSF